MRTCKLAERDDVLKPIFCATALLGHHILRPFQRLLVDVDTTYETYYEEKRDCGHWYKVQTINDKFTEGSTGKDYPFSDNNITSYIGDKVTNPRTNSLESHLGELTKRWPKNKIPASLCYLCKRHKHMKPNDDLTVADFIKSSNLTEHYEGKNSLKMV